MHSNDLLNQQKDKKVLAFLLPTQQVLKKVFFFLAAAERSLTLECFYLHIDSWVLNSRHMDSNILRWVVAPVAVSI